MKRILIGIIILVLVFTTVACASKTTETAESESNYTYSVDSAKPMYPGSVIVQQTPPPEITLDIPTGEGAVEPTPPTVIDTTTSTTDRMIIRTGNIDIVVEDVQVAIEDIAQLAESMQGFVVNSTTWRQGNALYGNISIRVPADSYNSALRIIRDSAVEVNSENTASRDVTEEYVDLQAKLKNLEATEQQLLKIMEQATTVESILKVQSQLTETRSQIESLKGSIQYIERTTAMSLIQVQLQQAKLYAEITVRKAVVQAGEPVYFYAEISGGFTPFSYEWDFGDDATSTNPNPVHSYSSPGDYTINLKVTDDRGNTATATRDNYVNVIAGWEAGNTVHSAWSGLKVFGQVLLNILIWIGIFSPIWIIVGGIAFYFWWRRKKNKAAKV